VRRVKEADGADDAVTGLDQVVAVESRQLTQSGKEGVLSLLDELVGAVLVTGSTIPVLGTSSPSSPAKTAIRRSSTTR
jgi:hypothetical protein